MTHPHQCFENHDMMINNYFFHGAYKAEAGQSGLKGPGYSDFREHDRKYKYF